MNKLIIGLLLIVILLISGCVMMKVYDTSRTTRLGNISYTDKSKLSFENLTEEQDREIMGEIIKIEQSKAKNSIIINYIWAIGILIFLFYCASQYFKKKK